MKRTIQNFFQNFFYMTPSSRVTLAARAVSHARSSVRPAAFRCIQTAPRLLVSLLILLCVAMVLPAQSEASGGKQGSSFSEWEQIPGSKRQTSSAARQAEIPASSERCEQLLQALHPALPLPELDGLLCELLVPLDSFSRATPDAR